MGLLLLATGSPLGQADLAKAGGPGGLLRTLPPTPLSLPSLWWQLQNKPVITLLSCHLQVDDEAVVGFLVRRLVVGIIPQCVLDISVLASSLPFLLLPCNYFNFY